MSADTFDAAYAEFLRLKAIENAFADEATAEPKAGVTSEWEAALGATDAAFDTMIVIPVSDGPRIWSKFAAILDHYHVGGFGLDEAAQAQVFAEARAALTGEAGI